jgi:signal transduction histidine kinase/CheY-like chemotaxis protein
MIKMNGNLGLSISGFLYIFLTSIVFFRKKRLNKFENNIYAFLIIDVIVQLIFGLISTFTIYNITTYPLLNMVVNKIYLVTFAGWGMLFAMYVMSISLIKANDDHFKEILKSIYIIIFVLMTILISISPISFYNKSGIIYSTGISSYITYFIGGISILIAVLCIIINHKALLNKKYIPTYVFIVLGSLFMLIQMKIPGLFLVSPLEVFTTFLMYFTIENPDVQAIEELTKNKQITESTLTEKSEFIATVTSQMKFIINNVDDLCTDSLNYDLVPPVKSNILEIKGLASTSRTQINDMLNISNEEIQSLRIVKNKYNLKLLIKEIERYYQDKIATNIDFRVNIASDIPDYLYGDSLKLKQVITTLINNSIKYTKEGFIELRISSIKKYNIYRLIISVEDSGKGMSLSRINEIMSNKSALTEEELNRTSSADLNLKIIKKIVELSSGILTIDSKENIGTKIKLFIDETAVNEKQSVLSKYADEMLKQKKIAIITTNSNNTKLINNIAKKMGYLITDYNETKKCLDDIRSSTKYELIFIDEKMDKIDSRMLLEKFKKEKIYNGKLIVLTTNNDFNNKKDLLEAGFNDTIKIPIDKEELKNKFINWS